VQETSHPESAGGNRRPESAGLSPAGGARSFGRFDVERLFLRVLAVSVFGCCAAYCFFTLFSTFKLYDDEGKHLLFVRHLLDGRAIYDDIHSVYGPFYFFERWMLFGLLRLPLTNDVGRAVTFVSWCLAALILAATAWRIAGKTRIAFGLAAIAGTLSVLHLSVLSYEPNHPQEVIAVLLALAFWTAATMKSARRRLPLCVLGGLGAALVLTKINVGIFYCIALAVALVALTRPSPVRTLLKFLLTIGVVILPLALMRSRLADGYAGLCFFMTVSLLPCCLLLAFRVPAGRFGFSDWLAAAVGGLVILLIMAGFARSEGNTISGMLDALILRPAREYGGSSYGRRLLLPPFILAWAIVGAGFSLTALADPTSAPIRRLLWALRLVASGVALALLTSWWWDPHGRFCYALPLSWLLLVPSPSLSLSERDWFFRVLLAFSAVVEPLQIYPMAGSQMYIGTLLLPLATIVLLSDLGGEFGVVRKFFEGLRSVLNGPILRALRLPATIAPAAVLLRFRSYEILGHSIPLPSLTSVWALVAVGLGLTVLRIESPKQTLLAPLRLLVCGIVIAGSLTSRLWDTTWMGYALPLSWLLLFSPTGSFRSGPGSLGRLALLLTACLEPLHLLPIIESGQAQLHLGHVLMLFVTALLLYDLARAAGLVDPLGSLEWPARLNLAVMLSALVVVGLATFAAGMTYFQSEPLNLKGCRWTRVSERDASFYRFVSANVRASSDCFVPRFGLASAYFWVDQRPASQVIVGNQWEGMDRSADDALLDAHRDRIQMMFIDTPNPWRPDSPKTKFLSYVQGHFRTLARVGATRFLVREERTDLELRDCAFQPKAGGAAPNVLYLRLPSVPKLDAVAAITLVDLDQHQELASTSGEQPGRTLILKDVNGRTLSPSQNRPTELPTPGRDLRLIVPASIRLDHAEYPALRFVDGNGLRLLTLPVALQADVPIR
jgi:hypothetical protein